MKKDVVINIKDLNYYLRSLIICTAFLHIQSKGRITIFWYSPLSNVLDHNMAADVKEDFLSNFLYIVIIFK